MVVAGRRDRRLHVHPPIHHVEDREQHGADDARPARAARHHEGLAVLDEQRRGHARKRPLARRNGVGAPGIHEPIGIRGIGRHGKIIHLVVENDPGARHGDAGTIRGVDRHGDPHHAPLAVGHREMRGARIVRRQTRRLDVRSLGGVDPGALGLGVLAGDQPGHGHIDEIAVAHVGGAIREGELHGLGHRVETRRTAGTRGGEIKTFEDVETLKQHGSARRRRREGVDLEAAVLALHRRANLGRVALEICKAEDAAAAAHLGDNLLSDGPALDNPRPRLRNGAQGTGEIRLHEHFSHFGPAIRRRGKLNAHGFGKAPRIEAILERVDARGLEGSKGKAFGEFDGGGQHPGQRQRAPALEHQRHAGGETRDRHGEGAVDRRARGQTLGEIHIARGGGGGRLPGIEGDHLAIRTAHQRKGPAPEPGREGLGHRHRKGRGHGRIHRVAPGGQHRRPGLGGQVR